jgi:CBS domain-containing protein
MAIPQVRDVMTRVVVTVRPEVGVHELADLLVRHAISAVPVVAEDGRVLGVISETDLVARLDQLERPLRHPLLARRLGRHRSRGHGDTAGELMSSPAITVSSDASVAKAARQLEAARVRRLPVVDDGQLVGIVSRRDLVRLYARTDDELASVVAMALRGLWLSPSEVRAVVAGGSVTLTGAVDRRTTAEIAAQYIAEIPGVVSVANQLTFEYDDQDVPGEPWYRSNRVVGVR